jgi:aryl-alcohol dehydrogenase-like predicted oxidoreductase
MQYRTLGRTGIRVSAIGYGAWGIGGGWGITDDAQALRALQRARELGVTLFDTARGYGNGHSEELLGKALAAGRAEVVISTKIPPKTMRWPVLPQDPIEETFPPDWVVEQTEASLRALNTDYLDLQQLHAWTDSYTLRDEWYGALAKLRDQGKIRAFGVSTNDWDPYGAAGLVESGRTDTVQVIYNIFDQRPVERLLPAAARRQAGVLVRVPLEEGLLTGTIRPGHHFEEGDWRGEWLTPERLNAAEPRLTALQELAESWGQRLPELALRFCLSHPAVSSVLVGMRRLEHVVANTAVADQPLLSDAQLAELRKHTWVHGWKYPWSQED